MSDRTLPTLGSTFRFDTIAQIAGFVAVVGLLTPVIVAVQDGEDTSIVAVVIFLVVAVVAIAVFAFRMVLLRRRYANGEEATGTVVEVRPASFGSRKTIVYDYPLRGETRRRSYSLSEKLLSSARPDSTIRLIVPNDHPDRPFLRDLFE